MKLNAQFYQVCVHRAILPCLYGVCRDNHLTFTVLIYFIYIIILFLTVQGIEYSHHKLDFRLTVHHQLGKVIQKNQLDATMIY